MYAYRLRVFTQVITKGYKGLQWTIRGAKVYVCIVKAYIRSNLCYFRSNLCYFSVTRTHLEESVVLYVSYDTRSNQMSPKDVLLNPFNILPLNLLLSY